MSLSAFQNTRISEPKTDIMASIFKITFVWSFLLLPFFIKAQCPVSLNNTNGSGALTLYFDDNVLPDDLNAIDVDFPTISGNYSVMELPTVYQTISTAFSGATLTGDVTLNFSSGPSLECAYEEGILFDPLPVELSRFEGVLEANHIQLTWTTESEKNNLAFEIEQSFDGERFEVVGLVEGAGNSEIAQEYSFLNEGIRNRALGSSSYYRLVQNDFDGTKTYSDVIAIDLNLDFEKFEITKITGWDSEQKVLQVYFYNPSDIRKVNFLVSDISGRIIERQSVYPEIGLNAIEIDLSTIAGTFFFLSLDNGKEVIGKKVAIGSSY